jgi:hypothetical protein
LAGPNARSGSGWALNSFVSFLFQDRKENEINIKIEDVALGEIFEN